MENLTLMKRLLAIAGRYVFTPAVFDCIKNIPPERTEIQLTDAMRLMLKTVAMYGLRFDGML